MGVRSRGCLGGRPPLLPNTGRGGGRRDAGVALIHSTAGEGLYEVTRSEGQELAESQLEAFLIGQQKGKYRISGGETWIDHFCLFHDDGNARGASIQIDSHAYKCRHGSSYTWEDVLAKAGILHRVESKTQDPALSRAAGERAAAALLSSVQPPEATRVPTPLKPEASSAEGTSPRERVPQPSNNDGGHSAQSSGNMVPLPVKTRYTYLFPESGDVSHYMERVDYEDRKEFYWLHPDGTTKGKPEDVHPIYGDYDIPQRSYVIVVEGEKCVDEVHRMGDSLDAPIKAVTWANGSGSADKYSVVLAHRLAELNPKLVIIWPDNDIPGGQAMTKITNALKQQGIEYYRIKPKEYGWPPKYDAADYVNAGESLAKIVDDCRNALPTAGVQDFVDKLLVTQSEMVVYPGTRKLWPLRPEYIDALWQKEFGTLPRAIQARDAISKLRQKSSERPTITHYRTLPLENEFYWRPSPIGDCWHVNKDGIDKVPDPPGSMLVVHEAQAIYPTEVDVTGTRDDFVAWCEMFHLTPLDMAVIEAWLVCALTGLQTPIMLMRGEAGTGKTTFARSLVSIIEPIVMELDATQERKNDNRGFLQQLNITPTLLMDNVSALSYQQEDVLSKLVTGFTTTLRTLYTTSMEVLSLHKAIVITTVHYDVFKSDLASRIVLATPTLGGGNRYKSNRHITQILAGMIPRVRGYVFLRCQEFYERKAEFSGEAEMFRVGDMGWVLRSLGYDADELSRAEAEQKSLTVNQDDPVLDAIVDWWQTLASQGATWHKVSSTQLCKNIEAFMRSNGADDSDIPRPSKKFSRYMEEKRQIFRDFGFDVTRIRDAMMRGFHFQVIE